MRVAQCRRPLDRRAAGIGQAQHFCAFIEGFAQRIVERAAKQLILAHPAHQKHLTMAARHQQKEIRECRAIRQPHGQRMAFQMVHRDDFLTRRRSQPLSQHHPHDNPANQPRPCGDGNRIHFIQRQIRIAQRGFVQPIDILQMRTRRDFRHHATIGRMLHRLALQSLRQYHPVLAHQGDGCFIAARFNAQHNAR